MSTTEIVYPYRIWDGIDLRLSDFTDVQSGESLRDVVVSSEEDLGQRRYDLTEAKPEWTATRFDVEFEIPQEEVERLVPNPTAFGDQTVGMLSVSCASTKYRRGLRLRHLDNSKWSASIDVQREDVRGIVELTPVLVRIADMEPPVEDYASFAGAVLATGRSVQLVLDRFARRYDGSMEYVWEHFGNSKNDWRLARKEDVFQLEPADVPRLFLNLRWGFLKPILDFESRNGTTAGMRDLMASAIGQGVWTELLVTSIASIQDDGDGWSVGGEAWRTDLVRLVLGEVYPEVPEDDRMRTAYEEWRDPATAGTLVSKIGSVAQARSNMGKLFDRAVKAVEASQTSTAEERP